MADTMREKLIDLLSQTVCDCIPMEDLDEVVNHLITNGVTVQQWIPASEPPKDRGEYIVMIKGAKRSTTLWYHPMRETWEECGGLAPYPVTHWMPLPEPPKE